MKIEDYLSGSRLKHSLSIKNKMESMLCKLGYSNFDNEYLIKTAELHDIGYSDSVVYTGFHPLDGYLYLKSIATPSITVPILLHTNAESLVRYTPKSVQDLFDNELTMLKQNNLVNKQHIDLLSYCDATTGPNGEWLTLEQRYTDIEKRYSEKDYRSIIFKENINYYKNIYKDFI